MKTTKTSPSVCTACGERLGSATSTFGDHEPRAGDVSICQYCGHLMVFGDGLVLRNPTDGEMLMIAGDKKILSVQRARALFKLEKAGAILTHVNKDSELDTLVVLRPLSPEEQRLWDGVRDITKMIYRLGRPENRK